jgi:hypothetical protein
MGDIVRTSHVKDIVFLVLLCIALAGCAPAEADQQRQWEVVLQTEVTQPVRMGAFLDENFGLTGGASNRAYVTTDGGQAWTMAESGLA